MHARTTGVHRGPQLVGKGGERKGGSNGCFGDKTRSCGISR